jgi:glycosyltransferase involved in cell wall biosynthesis
MSTNMPHDINSSSPALVTICIPTYKGAAFIGATIESLLAQSCPSFEAWILDDQSPDATEAVVRRYDDPRIHYLRNEHNLGPQENWNKALKLAKGRYFKLLPHDDLLAPDCLREQVALLESDTEKRIALVFGFRQILNPQGKPIMRRGLGGAGAGEIPASDLLRRCVRAGTNLIGEPGNGLFRSELIALTGPYDGAFPYLIDLDYWARILMHGKAFYTASHSSSFRLSKGSWSAAIGSKQFADFKGFSDRLAANPYFELSGLDQWRGRLRARMAAWARMIVYRFVF